MLLLDVKTLLNNFHVKEAIDKATILYSEIKGKIKHIIIIIEKEKSMPDFHQQIIK